MTDSTHNKTSLELTNMLRDRAGIEADYYRTKSSTLRKAELRHLCGYLGLDVDGSDTTAELRATVLREFIGRPGTTAVDTPGSFTKHEKTRLLKEMDKQDL